MPREKTAMSKISLLVSRCWTRFWWRCERQHRVVHRDNFLRAPGFYRGDHFEFFSAGVPELFLGRGKDFIGQPASFGLQKLNQYFGRDYHLTL